MGNTATNVLPLLLLAFAGAHAFAAESPAVAELRSAILKGPHGTAPARDLVADFIATEGGRLQGLYVSLALRKHETLPVLLETLDNGAPAEKRKVTKLLRRTRWPEAVPKLLEIASSDTEHPLSRIGALYALGAIGERSAAANIAPLLDRLDRGPTEKRILIATLGRLKHIEAASSIEEYLDHEDALVRIFTAAALAEMGQDVDVGILSDVLRHDDYVVRQEACGALGALSGPDVDALLTDMSRTDPHSSVRRTAKIALRRIQISAMPHQEKAQFLRRLVSDSDKKVRAWALRTLAWECGDEGIAVLGELAAEPPPGGKRSAIELLMLSGAQTRTETEVTP